MSEFAKYIGQCRNVVRVDPTVKELCEKSAGFKSWFESKFLSYEWDKFDSTDERVLIESIERCKWNEFGEVLSPDVLKELFERHSSDDMRAWMSELARELESLVIAKYKQLENIYVRKAQ